MKSSLSSYAVTTLSGAAVAVLAASLQLEPAALQAAYLGSGVSTLAGLGALWWKGRVAEAEPTGTRSLKALFSAQVLVLAVRVLLVLGGALAIRAQGQPALVAFVLAFFAVYALQQVVEVRFLLAAKGARAVSR